jgi:lipoprotein-anchoring transpeptidase ErfK/SrfK
MAKGINMRRRAFLGSVGVLLAAPHVATAFTLDQIYRPQYVTMKSDVGAGQILVLPRAHFLYFVTEPGRALRYGIGVGRAGLAFTGAAVIARKATWPSWRPTNEMIQRDPKTYSRFVDNKYVQPGGPDNPLGSRALYLYKDGRDTYFRIHGTTEPESIGLSVSNGCIRMINEHVQHLYNRVPIGTRVTVL